MADAEDEECADSSRSSTYLSGQRDATTGGREEGIAEEELRAGEGGGGRKKSQGRNREGGRKEPTH